MRWKSARTRFGEGTGRAFGGRATAAGRRAPNAPTATPAAALPSRLRLGSATPTSPGTLPRGGRRGADPPQSRAVDTTARSATDLARAIRSGELSAREVVEAHAWRLHRAQPRTNALARDRFEAALAEASEADERIAATPPGERGQLPPFLGVPCTVKESIGLAGMPNSAGLVSRRSVLAEETAPAAQRMLDAGFIPLGVTNTSEMTMWIESDNRVYGRTRNAYDPHRIAGGSSGGEGAAVGSGGAPVGLGSDIGGSIRLPAFFNGVFGHKPSPGLVPNTGQFPSTAGEAARMLTRGPLVRRAEGLMPLVRLISGPDGQDARVEEIELGDPADVGLG